VLRKAQKKQGDELELKEANCVYTEDAKAANRQSYYASFRKHFGLAKETKNVKCDKMETFPSNSAGKVYSYFSNKTCKPVKWATQYSLYTRDDYKRCVCEVLTKKGATDCPDA